jgi:aminopeptidase N
VLSSPDWVVTSTCRSHTSTPADASFGESLASFNLSDKSDLVTRFQDAPVACHRFDKSVPISTYIYSLVAGAYSVTFPKEADVDPQIPMRLLCRKSLAEHVEKMKDDWFRITIRAIRFYEIMFNTPYPFDKLDQTFCPDYRMGAMENVGNITYNDEYVPRNENFTRVKMENIYNTITHEISHMWFGNLVTMEWWDDLWLNESFANMISFMCMDEAEGLEDITLAWNIFLGENFWGLGTD